MRILLSFLFALIVMQPSNMFASNKQFYKNIDYSNLDLIGIVKNKGKGEYKIRTVQPLSIDEKNGDTIFLQGMIGNFSQFGKYRIGTNLGIGFRNFNDEFSKMYGYNFFYDSEPDPGHHRIGLGLEFKQTRFGINNNYYLGLTDKKSYGDSGLKEEVLNGTDIILSGLIPRVEWIETDLSYAYWDSVSSSDLYEVKLGFNFNISDYITLNLEAEDDNKNSISYNAGLSISIGGNNSNKVSLLGQNKMNSLEDMRNYNLVPVKRSEKITLEQSGGFSVKVKKSG
tara:strand:- start:226 stop:1074 length:849 start_codon:yes stop_codon:yes gene_type:complete